MIINNVRVLAVDTIKGLPILNSFIKSINLNQSNQDDQTLHNIDIPNISLESLDYFIAGLLHNVKLPKINIITMFEIDKIAKYFLCDLFDIFDKIVIDMNIDKYLHNNYISICNIIYIFNIIINNNDNIYFERLDDFLDYGVNIIEGYNYRKLNKILELSKYIEIKCDEHFILFRHITELEILFDIDTDNTDL